MIAVKGTSNVYQVYPLGEGRPVGFSTDGGVVIVLCPDRRYRSYSLIQPDKPVELSGSKHDEAPVEVSGTSDDLDGITVLYNHLGDVWLRSRRAGTTKLPRVLRGRPVQGIGFDTEGNAYAVVDTKDGQRCYRFCRAGRGFEAEAVGSFFSSSNSATTLLAMSRDGRTTVWRDNARDQIVIDSESCRGIPLADIVGDPVSILEIRAFIDKDKTVTVSGVLGTLAKFGCQITPEGGICHLDKTRWTARTLESTACSPNGDLIAGHGEFRCRRPLTVCLPDFRGPFVAHRKRIGCFSYHSICDIKDAAKVLGNGTRLPQEPYMINQVTDEGALLIKDTEDQLWLYVPA